MDYSIHDRTEMDEYINTFQKQIGGIHIWMQKNDTHFARNQGIQRKHIIIKEGENNAEPCHKYSQT